MMVYIVLELIATKSKTKCYLQRNGEFAYKDSPESTSKLSICLMKGWEIFSVKRNDGVKFTIGDMINKHGEISQLRISSIGNYQVKFEKHVNKLNKGWVNLSTIDKKDHFNHQFPLTASEAFLSESDTIIEVHNPHKLLLICK